jgi:hypothetical protein
MAPAEAAAERAAEVRRAARAWAAAGAIDDATRAAIEARYPDDRVRLPAGLRIVAFALAALAVLAACVFVAAAVDIDGRAGITVLALVFALSCAAGTELQRGRWRRADAGAETATALLAPAFAILAIVAGLDGDAPDALALGLAAAVTLVAAARWGTPLLALVAAVLVFLALAELPAARLLWVLVATAALGPLLAGCRHAALAPSQRLGCWLAVAVALAALVVALNLLSWDQGWVEGLWGRTDDGGPGIRARLRPVAIIATALLPLVFLVAGLRRREILLLLAGLAGLAIAAATLRWYRPVLPLAYALVLAGAVLMATAFGLRRWLAAGPAGERGGWTADPLFGDDARTGAVKAVAGAVAFTPAARPATPPDGPGDGRFGGGGASGSF